MDDDDISIYTLEELERLESLRVREFVHPRVYDVNRLKKGEMDINLPTLFCVVGWTFVMRFVGSPLLVEGIRRIEHTMEGLGRAQVMLRSSINS
jgi:DMSO/TMAO reductase YedYZ molybdopterin-dependent catalytic subunit